MYRRRLAALAGLAAGLLLVFAAMGVARAPAAASQGSCDPAGTWNGTFTSDQQTGDVTFTISTGEDPDGLPDPLTPEKDNKIKFTWSVQGTATNLATAQGTGVLDMTSDGSATFSISGRGTQPENPLNGAGVP